MQGEFKRGEQVTAARLNELQARVDRVRERLLGSRSADAPRHVMLRQRPRWRFGFEVSVLRGVLCVRPGLVDWGGGRFERVPASAAGSGWLPEWVELGTLSAGVSVWLVLRPGGGSGVSLGPYDHNEVSTGLRRRLAVVLPGAEAGSFRLVQVLGGLVSAGELRGYAGSPDYWAHSGGAYRVSAAEDVPALSHGYASAGAAEAAGEDGASARWGMRYEVADGGRSIAFAGGC